MSLYSPITMKLIDLYRGQPCSQTLLTNKVVRRYLASLTGFKTLSGMKAAAENAYYFLKSFPLVLWFQTNKIGVAIKIEE